MLPVFGNEKRRRINLGGQVSVHTHDSIVNQAKARREEREDRRRQHDAAVRIQAWWRGTCEAQSVKRELVGVFKNDPLSISGLRCLVLIGKDEQTLRTWSTAVVDMGETAYIQNATGPYRDSWIVLVRRAALLLLQDIATQPQAERAVNHLKVLDALTSPTIAAQVFGDRGREFSAATTGYLLRRGLYRFLALAIINSPLESKDSATLSLLVPIITHPLRTYDHSRAEYALAFGDLVREILSVPLLPNRIPLMSLTNLSSNLPLSAVSVLSNSVPAIASALSLESRIHLISNLLAFAPPRYSKLSSSSLETTLRLFVVLMNSLPVRALDPPSSGSAASRSVGVTGDYNSDDDDTPIFITDLSTMPPPTPALALPALDPRSKKRLQTIATDSHVKALLTASQRHPSARLAFFEFVLALCTIWPSRSNAILMMLMVSGAGVFRELYRGYVRSSTLGKDGLAAFTDPTRAQDWPPLLVLNDLYAQALLTMTDDEFFSNDLSLKPDGLRNPLTLDEVVAFSRVLLKIAFTLYWREDQNTLLGTAPGTNLRWDAVREKVTKGLLAIHARDSRRPFVPPEHWLVTSHLDMNLFIEAAITDDRRLTQPTGSRALSSRQVASISPQLGVLNNIPFAIPFETRFRILRAFIEHDRQEHYQSMRTQNHFGLQRAQHATVRRGHISEDGFDKLGDADLKGQVQITFIDQFGEVERGIDGGGVFKEFLTEICTEVFDSDRGLWLENKKNELYPNPHTYATESHSLAWYRFIGRILGKAIYEGLLVNVVFAGFFLAKWLGKSSLLDDLASLDPELYQGLLFLKRYTGNPEDLSLNFTIALEEFGAAKTIDLIPNGSNIPVTRDNRLEYIVRISHFRLTKQIKRQSEAFFEGLSDMIDPKWLRMFNQQELQILLGGVDTPIDIDDWRAHTKYGGLFDANHPTVAVFWAVVKALTDEQQRSLLRFVTSVGRPPLLGFKELNPPFCIRDSGGDESRLPTASTCFNLLKMPRYTTEIGLRQKLLQSLFSGAGFDLS